jgi:uncharacterized membrane protein
MTITYNRIAGQSVGRLAALSDGIFAFAMTLLVIDLHTPISGAIHSEHELWRALVALGPQLVVWLMSLITLAIFWVGQQTQLNYLERSHRTLAWIHMVFLFTVTMIPFSTRLLGQFPSYRLALGVYWLNIFLIGVVLYLSWDCAVGLGLAKSEMPREVPAAIKRRIVVAQALYAFGALLCVFNTHYSIAFIALVQLNYAIAPRFWRKFKWTQPLD